MGCSVSRHVNPIDVAMTQALREAKKRRGKKEFAFNELLLKFGTMADGFIKAREYFASMDLNKDKLIDIDEFITMAPRVGLDMAVEDLKNVFDAADLDKSTKIDVFEFMLVFVTIQLLSPERALLLPPEIRRTLEIVEDAFCCFDASDDGLLEPAEVAAVLCAPSTPGRATRALSDRLFAQLDFDGSGGISFKEFLIGLEKMVMEEYAGEHDEHGGGGGEGSGDGGEGGGGPSEAELVAAAKRLAMASTSGGGGGGARKSAARRSAAAAAAGAGSSPRSSSHHRGEAGSSGSSPRRGAAR